MKNTILYLLFAFLTATGCEDMMTKKLDIDQTDFPPRLCVTATLDTDSGRFTLTMYEGRSLVSYNTHTEAPIIIKNGVVNLYENGLLVWTLSGAFDLSRYKGWNQDNGAYQSINVKDVPAKAGNTYRLEIDVDGYQKVVSTVVMPADPVVDDVSIDDSNLVEKKNVNHVSRYGGYWGTQYYYPVKCTLADDTPGQDYYALKIMSIQKRYESPNSPQIDFSEITGVGVSNLALIQDNPDRESESSLLGDGTAYDLYMFSTLLLSDITFSGKNTDLELFTSRSYYHDGDYYFFPKRPADYTPEKYGPEVLITNEWMIVVGHITAETFKHYRSMVLQDQGMGFFAEPVMITSNVENGYGCFSLQNNRRILLKEYTTYYYPERPYQLTIDN